MKRSETIFINFSIHFLISLYPLSRFSLIRSRQEVDKVWRVKHKADQTLPMNWQIQMVNLRQQVSRAILRTLPLTKTYALAMGICNEVIAFDMKRIHALIHGLFNLLFGEFNGVQVFLYPMTIFWWIDSRSFLYAITGLLTNQKHFFPLCLFLLLGLYIAFMIVKNSSSILEKTGHSSAEQRYFFYKMVIEVHKTLLITLIGIGMVYMVSTLLSYYYGIEIPLKIIYPYVLRGFSIFLIIYYVLLNNWTKKLRNDGTDMLSALNLIKQDIYNRPKPYLLHILIVLILIFMGSYVYNLIVENLLFPLLLTLHIAPKLLLLPPVSILTLLYDVFIFGVAFMLSNLVFSPIVSIVMHYSRSFNPGERCPSTFNESSLELDSPPDHESSER